MPLTLVVVEPFLQRLKLIRSKVLKRGSIHSYESVKEKHGKVISQTLDQRIMILDFWDLWDILGMLLTLLFVGVILYSWWMMILMILIQGIVIPSIKKRNHRGVFLHYFYKKLNIELPELVNPKGRHKLSD